MNIFGLPIGAKPGDPVVGEVDGKPVYMTPDGRRYYEPAYEPQAPATVGEALTTSLDSQGRAVHDRTPYRPPGEGGRAIVEALMGEAWRGVAAPGRALKGEPVTYGDAWATALDWGVGSAPTSAPKGALRAGGMADDAKGIRAYHGSPHDFDRFSTDESMSDALWFSSDSGYAEGLAGRTNLSRQNAGSVYEVNLKFKNPLDVNVPDEVSKYADEVGLRGLSPEEMEDAWRGGQNFESVVDIYRPQMETGKHDAIAFRGTYDGYPRQTDQFVVFDENLIEIVRKYGIAGAAAALGMTNEEIQQRLNNAGLHSRP